MKTFFIVGAQRSGTTLLTVLLGKHKEVHIDLDTVVYRIVTCFGLYNQVLPYNLEYSKEEILNWLVENDYKGRLAKLVSKETITSEENVRDIIRESIKGRLEANGKSVFGDKAPEMEFFMPKLLMHIPDAKIIHVVRDGRAAAFSKYQRAHTHLLLAAQQWQESNLLALSNQAVLGKDRYKIVRYEDLLTNPEEELKKICEFLELPYDPEMLGAESEKEEQGAYVKSTLDKTKIDSYKQELSKKKIQQIEKIQGHLLKRLGYHLEFPLSSKKYKPMSISRRFHYSLLNLLKQLFIRKRMGMKSGKLVPVNVSFKVRLQTFVVMLCYELMPERNFNRIFRRRWVKNPYLVDEISKKESID